MGATRASDIERQEWPGMGSLGFIADSSDRILGDLFFAPGDAFNFHHHPNQEEVLYVTEGSLEAWVDLRDASALRAAVCRDRAGSASSADLCVALPRVRGNPGRPLARPAGRNRWRDG